MKIARSLTAASFTLAAVLTLPVQATAHDGAHPFPNCTAAKEAGYSNIPAGDEHYGGHLDRDGDGFGCDKHGTLANDGKAKTGYYDGTAGDRQDDGATESNESAPRGKSDGENLAETGGGSATPYIAGTAALLMTGGGYLILRRKRRS